MKGKKTEKKKNGSEVVNFSALCESRYAKMRCGGCRVRWYCSKECQVLHWKRGGHKQECQALLQSAAEEALSDQLANTSMLSKCFIILINKNRIWLHLDSTGTEVCRFYAVGRGFNAHTTLAILLAVLVTIRTIWNHIETIRSFFFTMLSTIHHFLDSSVL